MFTNETKHSSSFSNQSKNSSVFTNQSKNSSSFSNQSKSSTTFANEGQTEGPHSLTSGMPMGLLAGITYPLTTLIPVSIWTNDTKH
jgi:hypothetical protein